MQVIINMRPPKKKIFVLQQASGPRDIDQAAGNNGVTFEMAPAISEMNMCNIHFHRNAEHQSSAYSTYVEDGSNSGWACQEPAPGRLEEKHAEYNGCEGIAPGDTIEVH